MREDLKEHVGEATKASVELKERFRQWLAVFGEVEVVMEARRLQEKDLRQCFRRDAAARDLTDERTDVAHEKMWNLSQRNDTESKILVHDGDAAITLARRHGWTEETGEIARNACPQRRRKHTMKSTGRGYGRAEVSGALREECGLTARELCIELVVPLFDSGSFFWCAVLMATVTSVWARREASHRSLISQHSSKRCLVGMFQNF